MQVDTAALRRAAKRLRDEVADPLTDVEGRTAVGESAHNPDGVFDCYTTGAALRELTGSWLGEMTQIINAARELADAVDATAVDYDRSDADARSRMSGTR